MLHYLLEMELFHIEDKTLIIITIMSKALTATEFNFP